MKLFIFAILLLSVISIDALNKQDCKCRSQTGRRIVGGTVVNQYMPWYANLTIDWDESPVVCGATILNEKTILTAGHCAPVPLGKGAVAFMRVQINGEKLELEDIKTHPRYTRFGPFLIRNDLAIFKLKKPLTFNQHVQPACFDLTPQANYTNLKTVGYGSVNPVIMTNDFRLLGHKPSKNLKEALLRDVTGENEKDEFISVDGIEGRNKANPCMNDGGSPLVSEANGKSYVVGVIGNPQMKLIGGGNVELCTTGAYAARLSTPSARNFIETHVGDDYCH